MNYDQHGGLDRCRVYTDDKFFVPSGKYAHICTIPSNPDMQDSKFCKCVWKYREKFEEAVSII